MAEVTDQPQSQEQAPEQPQAQPAEPAPAPASPVVELTGGRKHFYGTGRRKTSVARVYLRPGTGEMVVNGRPVANYFCTPSLRNIIQQPLESSEMAGRFNITATVAGGGPAGQADALRLGIARALLEYDIDLRKKLKKAGFLTRDARIHERKKYGQKGARKRFQFSKR